MEKNYDLWADGYGETVRLLNDNDEYPFAGYAAVLNEVYTSVRQSQAKHILDVGFGTGIVTRKLYADGYEITGVDSSKKMVEVGKESMPKAQLVAADYSLGLPLCLVDGEYDMIISAYAFHHLDNYEQERLIHDLYRVLAPGGCIVIGGLAFESLEAMKELHRQYRDAWLYQGMYVLYDELNEIFSHITWKKLSKCAGVVTITKE